MCDWIDPKKIDVAKGNLGNKTKFSTPRKVSIHEKRKKPSSSISSNSFLIPPLPQWWAEKKAAASIEIHLFFEREEGEYVTISVKTGLNRAVLFIIIAPVPRRSKGCVLHRSRKHATLLSRSSVRKSARPGDPTQTKGTVIINNNPSVHLHPNLDGLEIFTCFHNPPPLPTYLKCNYRFNISLLNHHYSSGLSKMTRSSPTLYLMNEIRNSKKYINKFASQ